MKIGDWLLSDNGQFEDDRPYPTRDDAVREGIHIFDGETFFVGQVAIVREEVIDAEYKRGEE